MASKSSKPAPKSSAKATKVSSVPSSAPSTSTKPPSRAAQTARGREAWFTGQEEARPPVKIVPHDKKSGTDIFSHLHGPNGEHRLYVVRSDIGHFLEPPFENEKDFKVQPIHPTFKGGDHYFGGKTREYVIKGDECCSTSSLKSDQYIDTFELAENCKDGDHYCGLAEKGYAIITKKKVLIVQDLRKGNEKEQNAQSITLHDDYANGIYFWYSGKGGKTSAPGTGVKRSAADKEGNLGMYFVAMQVTDWGFEYVTTTCLSKPIEKTISFPNKVTEFIPGGLAFLMGPISSKWIHFDSVDNKEGDGDLQYKREMLLKVGYVKAKSNEVEKNWSISDEWSGRIGTKLLHAQIKVPKMNGGKGADTSKEDWSGEHSLKKEIGGTVQHGKVLHFWHYKFQMGGDMLLSTSHWKNTKGKRPTEEPEFIY